MLSAPVLELDHLTFACSDPDSLAAFWADALHGERRDLPDAADDVIVDMPDYGPSLLFREGPRGTDRDLPIHLDLATDDRAAEVERLEALGASVRETRTNEVEGHEFVWTVLEDPAGNGFCVTEGI